MCTGCWKHRSKFRSSSASWLLCCIVCPMATCHWVPAGTWLTKLISTWQTQQTLWHLWMRIHISVKMHWTLDCCLALLLKDYFRWTCFPRCVLDSAVRISKWWHFFVNVHVTSLSSSALDLFLKRAVKGLDFMMSLKFIFENCFDWKMNEVKIISHWS